MICRNCGREVVDGVRFCGSCGAAVTQESGGVEGSISTAGLPYAPVSKEVYLSKFSSKESKQMGWIARILAAVCAFIFLLGAMINLNMSIFDIPVIDAVIGGDGWSRAEAEMLADEADALLIEYEDILTAKEMKVVKKFVERTKDFARKPSISNAKSVMKSALEVYEIEGVSASDVATVEDEVMDVFDTISTVVWVIAIFLAAFMLLAGWRFASGWAVAAMILNILPGLLLVGWLYVVIATATIITFTVFNKKFNNAYNGFNFLIKNRGV